MASAHRGMDRVMLDWILKTVAAAWHRRRLRKRLDGAWQDEHYIVEWHLQNPRRCMVCSYTEWANDCGASLKPLQHNCKEGNGGAPKALPDARVVH